MSGNKPARRHPGCGLLSLNSLYTFKKSSKRHRPVHSRQALQRQQSECCFVFPWKSMKTPYRGSISLFPGVVSTVLQYTGVLYFVASVFWVSKKFIARTMWQNSKLVARVWGRQSRVWYCSVLGRVLPTQLPFVQFHANWATMWKRRPPTASTLSHGDWLQTVGKLWWCDDSLFMYVPIREKRYQKYLASKNDKHFNMCPVDVNKSECVLCTCTSFQLHWLGFFYTSDVPSQANLS